VVVGAAELRDVPEPFHWPGVIFVLVVLLFGAIGEEMLFRGYAFQMLVREVGPWAAILPVSLLFALAHTSNENVAGLGLVNTFAWGVMLGLAFVRSGDLWLPIGLHYGWNAILPLFGVSLSGFKMGVTGYAMHWNAGQIWSGGAYGPEGGVLTSIVLVPLAVFLWKAPAHKT
jgi:hypothetical protein